MVRRSRGFFLSEYAFKHNTKYEIQRINEYNRELIDFGLNIDHFDICLNTGTEYFTGITRISKLVNTFDTDGYCALVPFPEKRSIFNFIYKPFDWWTWILLTISMVCCVVVWHFLRKSSLINSNSSGYFFSVLSRSFLVNRFHFVSIANRRN